MRQTGILAALAAALLASCGLRLGGWNSVQPLAVDPGSFGADSALVRGLLLGPARLVGDGGDGSAYYRLQAFALEDVPTGFDNRLDPVARAVLVRCDFARMAPAQPADAEAADMGSTTQAAADSAAQAQPAKETAAADDRRRFFSYLVRQGYGVDARRPLDALELGESIKTRLAWECTRRLVEDVLDEGGRG